MEDPAVPIVVVAPATVLAPPEPPSERTSASISPTTSAEEDRHSAGQRAQVELVTAGQRRINLIWEVTQAMIALMVTGATLYVASNLAFKGQGETAAFLLLSNAFFVVITAYIQRTNHTKIGGVGKNETGR